MQTYSSLRYHLRRGFNLVEHLLIGSGRRKKNHELSYWAHRFSIEGPLKGEHYQHFYTNLFDLTDDDYSGKRVLDIGCGPRGSLEWADMALERVGLDPLAEEYKKLGADRHKMKYVAAPSEKMPFSSDYFDVVISFNSLDHVDNLSRTIGEIKRVTKPGGRFLLIVEIDHPPTDTEPITLSASVLDDFVPQFAAMRSWRVAIDSKHDVYGSVRANLPAVTGASSILCAQLVRQ